MNSYIRKLQSKPEVIRKQILLASLVFSMAIVGSVWIYSLADRFNEKEVVKAVETNEGSLSPFKLFVSSISSAYDSISASVGNLSSKDEEADTQQVETEKQIKLIPVEPRDQ